MRSFCPGTVYATAKHAGICATSAFVCISETAALGLGFSTFDGSSGIDGLVYKFGSAMTSAMGFAISIIFGVSVVVAIGSAFAVLWCAQFRSGNSAVRYDINFAAPVFGFLVSGLFVINLIFVAFILNSRVGVGSVSVLESSDILFMFVVAALVLSLNLILSGNIRWDRVVSTFRLNSVDFSSHVASVTSAILKVGNVMHDGKSGYTYHQNILVDNFDNYAHDFACCWKCFECR